ncbi:hypothetical protein [Francisella sp. SYW-9]|uniref:hypothetical protein n=1 Tax=Francisella sp. SYW-9 TaxID=2610888 RepID=UPI00123CDBDD|nr:hypothetical protein [Francisella sp. SYW-9]
MIIISVDSAESISKAILGYRQDNETFIKIFNQSLNRSIKRASSKIAKDISHELNIPLKIIRKRLLTFKKRINNNQGFKIWFGINDIPLDTLGNAKARDKAVIIKQQTIPNAYINHKNNRVYDRYTKKRKMLNISDHASLIANQRIHHYLNDEFEKNFTQLLRYTK